MPIEFITGLFLVLLANYTERKKDLVVLTKVFLAFVIILFILFGTLMFIDISGLYTPAAGTAIVVSGAFAFLLFVHKVRKLLSRVIPIDPRSWLHATGLALSVMFIGEAVANMSSLDIGLAVQALGGAGVLVALTALQDGLFVILGMVGVGWLTRKNLRQTLERLGIKRLGLKQFTMSLGFLGLSFGALIGVSIVLGLIDPNIMKSADDAMQGLGGIEKTIFGVIVFTVGAGVGEEVLFRGALQPRFGIFFSSLLFSMAHIQYRMPVMAVIFLFSVILAYERKMVNTTACMITHGLFNLIQLM